MPGLRGSHCKKMNQSLINRYQAGGDIYNTFAKSYGQNAADNIAAAALTGDETAVNAAITQEQFGASKDTSTFDAFASQIYNDPFAAPIEEFNKVAKNTVKDFLFNGKTLFVVLAFGVVVVLFVALGGLKLFFKK